MVPNSNELDEKIIANPNLRKEISYLCIRIRYQITDALTSFCKILTMIISSRVATQKKTKKWNLYYMSNIIEIFSHLNSVQKKIFIFIYKCIKIVVYRWILQFFFCETDNCWVMSWNSLKDEPKASPVKFLRITRHVSSKKKCKIQWVIYFIHVQTQRFDHKAKNTVFFHMYVDKIFYAS